MVTSDIPRPLANYTEAVRVGDFVFAAGQIASDYKTGVPARGAHATRSFRFTARTFKLQSATSWRI